MLKLLKTKQLFDLNSPLSCEGLVGDGCGGGRIFYIEDETLKAHDPMTQESIRLCENILNATRLSKSGCNILIECRDENIEFDLSSMRILKKEKL